MAPTAYDPPVVARDYAEYTAEARRRFDELWAVRRGLADRQRRAVEGVGHALRHGSMDRAIPERRLLYLDLTGPRPLAAIALGDLDTASHITWHLQGVGITPDTAMWGTVREAGQVLLEQRRVGAPNPASIAWLGYRPPGYLMALSAIHAKAGVPRFVEDYLRLQRFRPDRPHLALEGHSYGSIVAVLALEHLARVMPPGQPLVDAVVSTGSPGLPSRFRDSVESLRIRDERLFDAVARSDYIARAGRWLGQLSGARSRVGRELGVEARPELGLHPVTGHNSSHFVPGSLQSVYGYRDPGTTSLRNIARVTTGLAPI
ncbi:hypothetical protein GCM10022377_16720 [Zhihengliuella alba]|uniref:DUF1023 domain-containing protein n=1 Tax=Zhihengliuella alba TaxID=547018 RepID=A0ABP7DFB7_9MICC